MNTFLIPAKFSAVPRGAAPLGRLLAGAFLLLARLVAGRSGRREPIGPWLDQFPAERRHQPHALIGSIGRHCAAPAND